jgi:hypothetical protein
MSKKSAHPFLILLILLLVFPLARSAFAGEALPRADLPYKTAIPLILNQFDPEQAAPVIFTHPADQFVSEGGTASFTVTAGGMAPLSYQWQRSNNGGAVWSNVGANSAAYILNATQGDSGVRFRCLVTNSAGSALSNAATLTVSGCYSLDLTHTGSGTDPAASPANSPGCPAGQYAAGVTINLSGAVPTSGWRIGSWTGTSNNTSTASTNSLTMPADNHTVFVNYTQACYALTLTHSGQGSNPAASPAFSNGCSSGYYVSGTTVNLSGAVPASGWQISGWTGTNNNGSTANTNSLTMPAATSTASVNYTAIPPTCYALTLSHTGQGTDPVATPAYSTGCSAGYYLSGATVNLSDAVPVSGWHISGWTGTSNNGSTASTNSLTMPAGPRTASVTYAQDPSADRFAFVVTTDWHTSSGQTPVETNLQQIKAWIDNATTAMPAPSFMVINGDFPNVSQTQAAIANVLGSGFLWYPVIGNHEISDGISNFNTVRDTLVPALPYKVNNGPSGSQNTSYSWTYGDAHFTAVNAYWNGTTNAGADSARDGDIVPALRTWIEADLAAASQTHKFAFVHEPAYPLDRHVGDSLDLYPTNRDNFVTTLNNGNVQTLFVGHTHYFQHKTAVDYPLLGNVHQVTNGRFPGGDGGSTITYVLVDGATATYKVYDTPNASGVYNLRTTWTITR